MAGLFSLLAVGCSKHGRVLLPYDTSAALIIVAPDPLKRSDQDDAVAVAMMTRALEAQGFAVQSVLNASSRSVHLALDQLAHGDGARPRSRLFIYVRARGITQVTSLGKASGVLALADTGATPAIVAPGPLQAWSVQDLDLWVRRLAARHIFVAIDACFSGGPLTPQGAPAERLPPDPEAPTIQYLIAGDSVVCSAPSTAFAKALAQALTLPLELPSAHPDLVTGSEVGYAVQDKVFVASTGLQMPRVGKSSVPANSLGEIVFARLSRSAQ